MERIDRGSWCLSLALLMLGCGGSDTSSFVIVNEQGEGVGLDITNVLVQDCITRYWDPSAIRFDTTHPMMTQGALTISFGDSHTFELAPGCHDVLVARDGGNRDQFSAARVMLEPAQTVWWVPFRDHAKDSWWCEGVCLGK